MIVEVGKQYRFVGDEGIGRETDEIVTIIRDDDGDLAFFTAYDREAGNNKRPWCVCDSGHVPLVGKLLELHT